jgi:hypothetical protein
VPSDHVVSHPIQPLVEEVVTQMKYSADPTLLLESVESTKVFVSKPCLVDPTLIKGSDVSIEYGFSISSSVIS